MPRRRRSGGMLLIGAIIVVAALWLIYWYGAARIADAAFDRALAAATARGYTVECTDKKSSGFPTSVEIVCARASLAAEKQPFSASIDALAVSAPLYRPGRVVLRANGPLAVEAPAEGATFTADWSRATSALNIGLNGLSAVTTSATDLRIDLPPNSATSPLAGITAPSAAISLSPADEPDAYRLSVITQDAVIATEDRRPIPEIDLDLAATALDFGGSLGLDPLDAVREWLAGGGNLRLDHAVINAEDISIRSSGTLSLSANGKLNGTLKVGFIGIEALPDLAEAFHPGSRERASQIAASLAAFTQPVETPAGIVRETTLTIRDGVVSFGIIPIAVIPPLVL